MAKNSSWFTLVKILSTLAVISALVFLAIIAVIYLDFAKMKARDNKRKADLAIIRTALELNYKKHGAYTQPEDLRVDSSIGCTITACTATGSSSCRARLGCAVPNYPNGSDWDANSDLRDLVTDGFLKSLPKDFYNNATYHYTYEPGNADDPGYDKAGQYYLLCATFELSGKYCLTNKD